MEQSAFEKIKIITKSQPTLKNGHIELSDSKIYDSKFKFDESSEETQKEKVYKAKFDFKDETEVKKIDLKEIIKSKSTKKETEIKYSGVWREE